jgi:hypothetical protein
MIKRNTQLIANLEKNVVNFITTVDHLISTLKPISHSNLFKQIKPLQKPLQFIRTVQSSHVLYDQEYGGRVRLQ